MKHEELLALADAYAYRKALINGVGAARHSVPLAVMECDEARAALSDALKQVVQDADCACDRAYRNGMKQGFAFGENDDFDGYTKSLEAYRTQVAAMQEKP
jgi:hypothetical protein